MTTLQLFLSELIIWLELLAALVGLFYFQQLKKTYWVHFIIYLVIIFVLEAVSKWFLINHLHFKRYYYDLFVIPFQFLFLFWLYCIKSFQNIRIFKICCFVYGIFFGLHLFNFEFIRMISSMSYTIGVLIIAILVYLEFLKQIKSDEILNYGQNKMFYINIGVLLFYVGTLPFFVFDKYLFENDRFTWNNYLTFFLLSANVLYLFFTASFLWGKSKP